MTKYIWITIGVISLILIMAWKQAPKEPLVPTSDEIVNDFPFDQQEGEPIVSESGNIKVTRPQPGNTIQSPLLIKGEARVFEGTIQIRLKDAEGSVIIEKHGATESAEAGEFGNFGELLLFDDVKADEGVLEVYSIDASNGAEIDLTSIPVKF